jgi:hypothetical protein
MTDDIVIPTKTQREALCEMLRQALVEIRALGWAGRAEQVADLADAFHNLPPMMYGWRRWEVSMLRHSLLHYQEKWAGMEYVAILDLSFPPA